MTPRLRSPYSRRVARRIPRVRSVAHAGGVIPGERARGHAPKGCGGPGCPECRISMRLWALDWRRCAATGDVVMGRVCIATAISFRDGPCHHQGGGR